MKTNLKLAAAIAIVLGCTLFGGNPIGPDLRWIDRLDEVVQRRFAEPLPESLGMSRVMVPRSMGEHFRPNLTRQRDFEPVTPGEKEVVAALEERKTQVGLYVFGSTITAARAAELNFRALKGPGIVTRETPRPRWYPSVAKIAGPSEDALPDWNAIYPVAAQAMKQFREGGKGFETTLGGWNIAARPVMASEARCVNCHNNPAYKPAREVKPGQALGGVLYAFRRAG